MANNTANVAAGKPKTTGAIYHAPVNSTLPTDASTALDAAFKGLGYVTEDGLTQTISKTVENIKAWGGDTILTTQTEFTETFQFALAEPLSDEVQKVVFGSSNVSGALGTGLTTIVNSTELSEEAWVIEMVLHGAATRIVIPNGKVTEIGDITYQDGDVVAYQLTITALPDASGNCSYQYMLKA